MRPDLIVVGGGLAGAEAAWTAADLGLAVRLYEMRPTTPTPAHQTGNMAELVCSNSFGSDLGDRAGGLLKAELRRLDSRLMATADAHAVPAGGALAVDREGFAAAVTAALDSHPRVDVVRAEVKTVPEGPVVIASGPLTSEALAADLERLAGREHLYFYDALAPIVEADSIDFGIAFRASRYGRGEVEDGDYVNCPMTEPEYRAFVDALLGAERIQLREFETEDPRFFEGCLPIEIMAARGPDALAFGPMRPVGLVDPRTGKRPFAVVQLRQDNRAASHYNLVGFQTNLMWPEQRRVLAMIPGLGAARFVRLGQMHRNTFLNAPALLEPSLEFRARAGLFMAGQITGIEGYTGNVASGLVAGVNAARHILGIAPLALPETTMIGALCSYVARSDPKHFQPMKAAFGLLPDLTPPVRSKAARKVAYAERALADLDRFLAESGWMRQAAAL